METVKIDKNEYLRMQQTIQILQDDIEKLREIFFGYISENQKYIEKKPKTFFPDITEGDLSVSPVMLFGKWADIEIDAKKLRRESWTEY